MEARIKMWGNSFGIRLPKKVIDKMDIEVDDEVSISVKDNKIIMEKVADKQQKTLEYLFKDYDGKQINDEEIDYGTPVGDEVW